MYCSGFRRSFLQLRGLNLQAFSRNILSSEYFCKQDWDKRLQEPVFSGVNAGKFNSKLNLFLFIFITSNHQLLISILDEFFFAMKERIKMKMPVEPIDVDIFANVTSQENLEECVYFLTLLRENKRTAYTLNSTHQAVCRTFLESGAADKLLTILQDPLKYGVFPDNFSFNMILDHFLEKSDFVNATKVAHLYMLQEDFSPITNILSLNAVYGCLTDPIQKEKLCTIEQKPANEEETKNSDENDDDEAQYVRVPYVRNAHFDDHFDLKDPLLLTGKTLYLIGMRYGGIIGRTSQLIGLALWRKWKLAESFINKLPADSPEGQLAKGTLELITSAVELSTETDEEAKCFLEKLKNYEKLFTGEDIYHLVKKDLSLIPQLEPADISELKSNFGKWSVDRANALKEQLEKFMREEKIKEIKSMRKELELKERKLYFFENYNKIEMEYTEAKKKLDELKASEAAEEYFPPLIGR